MRTAAVTQAMQVCLGEHAIPVGTLTYSRQEESDGIADGTVDTGLVKLSMIAPRALALH